jgi:hypothetical protein
MMAMGVLKSCLDAANESEILNHLIFGPSEHRFTSHLTRSTKSLHAIRKSRPVDNASCVHVQAMR